jgi:Tfp pilus assembly protein PilN
VVWWILGAGFVVGVVLLVLACLPLVRRLRPLRLAAARLEARQGDALALQAKIEQLQSTVEAVSAKAEAAAAHRKPS